MEKISLLLISSLLSNIAMLYTMSRILDQAKKTKVYKLVLVNIFLLITSIGLYITINNFLRIIIYYMFLTTGGIILFKDKLNKIIFSSFLSYMILGIAEIITALFLSLFVSNGSVLFQTYALNIMVTISIVSISFVISSSNKIIFALRKLVNSLTNVLFSRVIIASFIGLFLIFFIVYCSYFNMPIQYLLITAFCFLACYVYILSLYFREINFNNYMKREYDNISININEYERIYNIQRMNSHEYKNQLLAIKHLIGQKNKKAISYIDNLISEEIKEDHEWFNQLNVIVNNGLKGILYYKIIYMKEKNINVNVIFGRNVNFRLLSKISQNTNIHLCKILGVILDNAIEGVLYEEEKNILINIYEEDSMIAISISNNFSKNINLSKMGTEGFTTKGKNHGYGLSLVKYIINHDNNLENYKEISGNIFTQIVKIKV